MTISSVPPLLPFPTARRAARIDFVGGEVNTTPDTAADSIPVPTNPACAGSCPLPPPETRVTLPAFLSSSTSSRITTRWSFKSLNPGFAATNPSRASSTAFNGSFISFFDVVVAHGSSHPRSCLGQRGTGPGSWGRVTVSGRKNWKTTRRLQSINQTINLINCYRLVSAKL